jgi:hypothetical protein
MQNDRAFVMYSVPPIPVDFGTAGLVGCNNGAGVCPDERRLTCNPANARRLSAWLFATSRTHPRSEWRLGLFKMARLRLKLPPLLAFPRRSWDHRSACAGAGQPGHRARKIRPSPLQRNVIRRHRPLRHCQMCTVPQRRASAMPGRLWQAAAESRELAGALRKRYRASPMSCKAPPSSHSILPASPSVALLQHRPPGAARPKPPALIPSLQSPGPPRPPHLRSTQPPTVAWLDTPPVLPPL